MEKLFNITLENRKILHHILMTTSKKDLSYIPENHNNNIWWNIAHVLVTQQLLVYKLSKVPMRIDTSLVKGFSKGTSPDAAITDKQLEQVADTLLATIEWTKEDYEKGVFKEYARYTTSANVTLNTVEDAIAFNVFHEGLHRGAILAIQKYLRQSTPN
ncbi:MAG: DinB family protein [Eudoraea sp.]|nr:DinB family protein [Eudoraea sp.]